MGKLILLVILGFIVALYFPESRKVLFEKGAPVLRPVLEWNAQREMEELATGLQTMENVERRLPQRREWVKWLDEHYTGDASTDPWGSIYGFELKDDSFAIISNGPDKTQKTPDDIRDVRIRNWRAKGSR
jgi:hypothetical protein